MRRGGTSLLATAALALGIGGATAIFSVADAVILRPLPFAEAERLMLLWQADQRKGQPFVELSYPAFRHWREQSRSFEDIAGMPSVNFGYLLSMQGEPMRVAGRPVTGGLFSVLGARPLIGRTLGPADELPGAPRVVLLSHALWRDRFASDAAVLGRSLTLDGQPHSVVGVMPRGFEYPQGALLWTALPSGDALAANAGVNWMVALGRLRRGVSRAAAAAELGEIARRYNEPRRGLGDAAVLTPLAEIVFGPSRPTLLALLGAVALVLLIACANVAGLLLVELVERSGEFAVRQALGASPWRLARTLLLESLRLAGAGGVAGVGLAALLTPLLVALSPADVFRLGDVSLDLRALTFALAVSLLSALACSLAPLLLLRRLSLEAWLRSGSRGVVSGRSRLRAGLVASEIALSLVLLTGAGLLFRSFLSLRAVPLGFEPAGLLSVSVDVPGSRYPRPESWRAFHSELLERVSRVGGVTSAASVTLRPLWGSVGHDASFLLFGQSEEQAASNPLLNFEAVSADYFRTMGIALRRGRGLDASDVDGAPGVVVVSESLARRCWPGEDPIGKRLQLPMPGTRYHRAWLSVVGVAADARYRELRESRLDLYMSFLQANTRPHHLVVRFAGDGNAVAGSIRGIVRSLDPDQPVEEILPMSSAVSAALGGPRFAALLFSSFALTALLLCALGLYGLLAFSVSRRTREIGVRVAVGATPASVRRLVLREGLLLALLGVAVGLSGAAFASRALSGLLFGVQPIDALTFAVVPALLLLVALLASSIPAARAVRVDPVVALRAD